MAPKVLVIAAVMFVTIFSASFIPASFAMGVPPGSCVNEFDGPITTFRIVPYPGVSLNPVNVAGGLTVELLNTKTYEAAMTVTTPSDSSKGNTNLGHEWWNSNYLGFYNGECTRPVEPSRDVTVERSVQMAPTLNPSTPNTYTTTWNTYFGNTVSYNIYWVPTPNYDVFIGVANYVLTVAAGHSVATKIYVASIEDYSGPVTFSITGPNGLTLKTSPSTVDVTAGGTATAALTASASSIIAKGTYELEVTDLGGHCATCAEDISLKIV